MKQKHSQHCCGYCVEWFTELDELEHHVRYAHAEKRMDEVSLTREFPSKLFNFNFLDEDVILRYLWCKL